MKPALRRLLTPLLAAGLFELVVLRREVFFRQQPGLLASTTPNATRVETTGLLLHAKGATAVLLREAPHQPTQWRERAVEALDEGDNRRTVPRTARESGAKPSAAHQGR